MKTILFLLILMPPLTLASSRQEPSTYDVCVYGGTSGGVMAAYTAKQAGKTVLLVEPGKHLGGLSSGGLGYTDIGNKYAISGLALDFYRRIGQHYGKFEQWIFEPHVAENLFQSYIQRADVKVVYQRRLVSVKKEKTDIREIVLESAEAPGSASYQTVRARVFLDCSYEGDLMAKAGVSYSVGREANAVYQETYNGVQVRDKHQFPEGIDPYRVPGKPESGLVWGVSPAALPPPGTGDNKVQAYNFRICLSDDPNNQVPIGRPSTYDSTRYELLLRCLAKQPAKDLGSFLKFDFMPNRKTDINNNGPFSTDMIGMNYDYPEGDYATRQAIRRAHEDYIKGLLYFIGHDPRMPPHLRELMRKWGYPKDEYADNGHWSPQMYVREARRMTGEYVMTQANCQGKAVVTDGVGMAAYTMDSHNIQRVVVNGHVKNEGDVQVGGFGPYPIAYRSLVPKAAECTNLLVPVCMSASHIAYGSIRMEPVFMVLSQSAAVAAVLAIDGKRPVQQIDVKQLQSILKTNPLADGSTPETLVDNDDRSQVSVKGNWKTETKGSFGPSWFSDEGRGGETKSVRFTPVLAKRGKYRVYVYFPKLPNGASQTPIAVFDGTKTREVVIRKADIVVEGQTSGEWVALGSFDFGPGKDAYVEISTKNADGVVVADAVRLVPDFR
ncbi:MAG: FAD-dependent oxidoreductase [Ferruginibacter sp.]|nr:FAD-dependent oxidoreductase [Cytophagales bacterium]